MNVIIDEESYLALYGASRFGLGESALHKNIQEGRGKRELLKAQCIKDNILLKKRQELRKEYNKKLETGECRTQTRIERLTEISKGYTDNEQTKAAKRLLNKLILK